MCARVLQQQEEAEAGRIAAAAAASRAADACDGAAADALVEVKRIQSECKRTGRKFTDSSFFGAKALGTSSSCEMPSSWDSTSNIFPAATVLGTACAPTDIAQVRPGNACHWHDSHCQ